MRPAPSVDAAADDPVDAPTDAQGRRLDASMDLLRTLRLEAIDPEYAAVAARGPRRPPRPVTVVALLGVVGVVLGLTVATQLRAAPATAVERADLIARITQAEADQDVLRERAVALSVEIDALTRASGGLDAATAAERDRLGVLSGTLAVTGGGVRVTLEDGPDGSVRGSRVVDTDLRMVAHGLWAAGAEAVAINGHRLSTRTPIRNAGDAITVDFRSLSAPYVVEAIGDPTTLSEAFAASEGGRWLAGLAEHYGVAWTLTQERALTLGADPGLGTERAERMR
ncbi:DUF881 domain-containing protein [Propioniciclava soli]|uniref:DUF881 domain-containing protein n=1 Tax=Propioniciclava soli TaxID=2775081 RepID=A0ABZ3CC19_9ACTN